MEIYVTYWAATPGTMFKMGWQTSLRYRSYAHAVEARDRVRRMGYPCNIVVK